MAEGMMSGYLDASQGLQQEQLNRIRIQELRQQQQADAMLGQALQSYYGGQQPPPQTGWGQQGPPQQQPPGFQPYAGGGPPPSPVQGGAPQQPSPPGPGGAPPQMQAAGMSPLTNQVLGQESGNQSNARMSNAGAVGPGQILPETWRANNLQGNINNPQDNRAGANTLLNTYLQQYGGDQARALVAYYSGPGNVAPPGYPTPWKQDRRDPRNPNAPSVSQYVQQTLARSGGGTPPGGGQRPGGAPGGPPGGLDLDTLMQQVVKTNPNAPPQLLMQALSRASQIPGVLNPNSKVQLMYLQQALKNQEMAQKQEYTQQNIEQRGQQAVGLQEMKGEQARELTKLKGEQQEALAREKQLLKIETTQEPTISKDAIHDQAMIVVKGGKPMSFGSGAAATANKAAITNEVTEILKQKNAPPEDIIRAQYAIMGRGQAVRTASQIGVRIEQATSEAERVLPVAREAVQKLDMQKLRSQFPSLNALVNTADEQIGDSDIVAAKAALLSLAGAWGSVITRGYQPRQEAVKQGLERLNAAYSANQLEGVFGIIDKEAKALEASNRDVFKKIYSGEFGTDPEEAGAKGGGDDPPKKLSDNQLKALQEKQASGVPIADIIAAAKQNGYDTSEIERRLGAGNGR